MPTHWKFDDFHKMCKENYWKSIVVASLQVLWDTVGEVQENIKIATVRYGCDITIASINAKITSYVSTS